MAAGFLFRVESLATQDAFFFMGVAVMAVSGLVLLVRFAPETEAEERRRMNEALAQRAGAVPAAVPVPIDGGG